MNSFVVNLFEPKRTPQQQMLVAFASDDADQRRTALAKIAKSKQHDADWAIKGYIAIVLLDDDSQTRCVAIRALASTHDPRAAETILKLLNYKDQAPEESVRAPDALCRWDAVAALADLSAAGAIPAECLDQTREALVGLLGLDPDRNVRIDAARGLGEYQHKQAVDALVKQLDDDDFAVVHQCEESLVRLTGTTYNCDPLAWETWVAANEGNLFAHAHEIPESRRPPYSSRIGKFAHDTKRLMSWLVPGRKEE